MVQGRTWRCTAAVARDEALCASALRCGYVKKFALRRGDTSIEAFLGLSITKSDTQLATDIPPGPWVVEQETRHQDKWRAVVVDPSFVVILPASDAILRIGLQPQMHVSAAWREKHTCLQHFEAGELVLSADGRSGQRTIHASAPSADGTLTRRSVVVPYQLPPDGEGDDAARRRADANREAEERAILSLDEVAAARMRTQHAAAERARVADVAAAATTTTPLPPFRSENAQSKQPDWARAAPVANASKAGRSDASTIREPLLPVASALVQSTARSASPALPPDSDCAPFCSSAYEAERDGTVVRNCRVLLALAQNALHDGRANGASKGLIAWLQTEQTKAEERLAEAISHHECSTAFVENMVHAGHARGN